MSLAKPVIYDGNLQRQVMPGDLLAGGEAIPATSTSTAVTVTSTLLSQGKYLASPAGGATFTLDTAANIVSGLMAGLGLTGIPNGTTFRYLIIITTAQTGTVAVTANTGCTVTRGAIASNGTKEFLVTITNGTPAQSYAGLTTNASAVVTGFTAAQLANLTPGMVVTNAVNGLQGTTIIGINIAAGSVTMSGNANATATVPVSISFSPTVLIEGLAA